MILLINICKEKLHFYEFVKPVADIVKKYDSVLIAHYKNLTKSEIEKADKIIICGTSIKNNEFLKKENLQKFNWLKKTKKPVLGICGGSHIIGLILGKKLKDKKEIGLKEIEIKKEFLGVKGKLNVYHLHQLVVLPETFQKKNLCATLFHPEVRNKEIIENFCRLNLQ